MSSALAMGILFALVASLAFRHAGFILFALLVWWVHDWLATDPARERNQMELRQDEVSRVEHQKNLVSLADVQVVFEQYGERLIHATVVNGSSVGVSNIALRCSYERPDKDDPWEVTTPVASTGVIQPGQSRRMAFALYGAASDAYPNTFHCDPVMDLSEADLLKTHVIVPKNAIDKVLAQTNIQVNTRLGQVKREYAPVIASGSITNNSQVAITDLDLTCSGIVDPLGLVASVRGTTSIYVAPGETNAWEFQVGKIHVEDEKFGIKDMACHVLTLHTN